MSFDVVVIGGGIVGCTSAFFLARQGLKVAVLERNRLAQGTSNNSFAWINATSKTAAEDYHRLNALGLAGYGELAAEFGETALGLNPCGALKIVRRSDAASYAVAQSQWRALQQYDYPVAWVSSSDLSVLEPRLNLGEDSEGLLSMADQVLDAPRFVRFMADRLRALGGRVIECCTAQALEMNTEGQITGLQCEAGLIKTGKIVLAAGPDTAEVLSQLTGFDGFAARFPVQRVPGLLLRTPDFSPHALVRHVIYWTDDPELHVLPDFNGGLKIGADAGDGMIANEASPANRRRAGALLLERVRARIKGFPENFAIDDCRIGVGIRPYPSDGLSLAGALPGSQGLYVIATHSGVTLAPALGQLMAQFIKTGRPPEQLVPFAFDRFPGFQS